MQKSIVFQWILLVKYSVDTYKSRERERGGWRRGGGTDIAIEIDGTELVPNRYFHKTNNFSALIPL